jgi:hypothetical protein
VKRLSLTFAGIPPPNTRQRAARKIRRAVILSVIHGF